MLDTDKIEDHDATQKHLWQVNRLLQKHKLIETLAHKQHLAELQIRLEQLDAPSVARIVEALTPDDREIIWQLITEERKEEILLFISDDVRSELVTEAEEKPQDRSTTIRVFDLFEGRLRQIPITSREDLAKANPIWIDLVAPDDEQIAWARELFEVDLPNPKELTDLETSARFYVEEGDEVHLQRRGGIHPAQGYLVLGAQRRVAGVPPAAFKGPRAIRLRIRSQGCAARPVCRRCGVFGQRAGRCLRRSGYCRQAGTKIPHHRR
jgi:hypothetical protein